MDRSFPYGLQKNPGTLALLIAGITTVILIINGYGLLHGITSVVPHLLYIPIVIAAYFYPRRGFVVAGGISAIYFIEVLLLGPDSFQEIIPAAGRIAMFLVIAMVVSFLTLRMQESEQQFRGVAERSSDIILLSDSDGTARYVSPSVTRIMGYDPGEITGHKYQDFIHPDDFAVLMKAVPEIIRGIPHEALILRMKRKDGEYVVLEFSASPVIQESQVTGIQVIGRDITDWQKNEEARRHVEQELRDANRRLADIINFLPDPTMVIDTGGKIVEWNQAMERLTGIPADSILGKGDYIYAIWFYGEPRPVLIDFMLNNDRDAIARLYPRFREFGHTIRAEVETNRPDGTRIDFWLTATPLFNQQGETVGAIESLRDVTHQKVIARAWRESKNYLDAIINTISDPVFVKDRMHRFVTVNNGFCDFIGHTREEILGKTDYDFFPKVEADIYRQKDEDLVRTREENENEEALTDARGNRYTIVTKKSLYINGDGEDFVVGIIRDISERKQMETALLEVNKKLNLLSSITRHDINNQLFSLKAFIELSKESLDNPTETSEFLLKAERAANAIEHQIAFTKEYQNLGVKAPVWQNVEAEISRAASSLPLHDVRVTTEVAGLEVYADPLLEKVFYNLIDNALRYGRPVMTGIQISIAEPDVGLIIIVEDNGAGISVEDKARLFERGFGKHTGLGLFLSREILAITGSTIAETSEPGKGARFEITVPKAGYRKIS